MTAIDQHTATALAGILDLAQSLGHGQLIDLGKRSIASLTYPVRRYVIWQTDRHTEERRRKLIADLHLSQNVFQSPIGNGGDDE